MNPRFAAALLASIGSVFLSQAAFATEHYGKTVSVIQTAISDCYYFMLTGVSQSDPITPNSPWFAISKTQANAKEMYTVLVAARTTGVALPQVTTSGATVCGHAQVQSIYY